MHFSVPQLWQCPLFGNTSSSYTQRNFFAGIVLALFIFFLSAAPNGHPRTFQNSATLIFSGSTFSAAPNEQKNFALLAVAVKIR